MIFEKAIEAAKRFLGVIGASVGGLTVIIMRWAFQLERRIIVSWGLLGY